jgi:hypothetical protein
MKRFPMIMGNVAITTKMELSVLMLSPKRADHSG